MEITKQAQVAIEKAQSIEDMIKNHPGWKHFMELLTTLLAQEDKALRGQKLDNVYYKKIGFLQVMKYYQELPKLLKDKKAIEYLLHQGRALGHNTVSNLPQYFFEGRQQGRQVMQSFLDEKGQQQADNKKTEYLEKQLGD